jgi:glutathione synthase/RimK-type ligase-like ATP-grasp enzyme
MKNSQRPLVTIIKEICSESGIDLESFSYDWIFRLSKNEKVAHIFGYQFGNNSATSQLICADKCATSDILLFNGVPTVKHDFFMSPININYVGVSGNWERILELLKNYGKVVCKTNEGSGGSSVYLVSNQFELERAVHKIFSHSRTMAVSPFYEVENEFRVVILDDKIMLIYSKNIPFVAGDGISTLRQLLISYAQTHADFPPDFNESDDDSHVLENVLEKEKKYYLNWKHNLGQGAYPEIIQDESLVTRLSELALKSASAVNIQFASVDIIKTKDEFLVLEINSGVMMDYFSQISVSNYQIAKNIYRKAIEKMLF